MFEQAYYYLLINRDLNLEVFWTECASLVDTLWSTQCSRDTNVIALHYYLSVYCCVSAISVFIQHNIWVLKFILSLKTQTHEYNQTLGRMKKSLSQLSTVEKYLNIKPQMSLISTGSVSYNNRKQIFYNFMNNESAICNLCKFNLSIYVTLKLKNVVTLIHLFIIFCP